MINPQFGQNLKFNSFWVPQSGQNISFNILAILWKSKLCSNTLKTIYVTKYLFNGKNGYYFV